jgi:hypothetical protein
MHKYNIYTPEHIRFLRDNVTGRLEEVLKLFNNRFGTSITMTQLNNVMICHKLRSDLVFDKLFAPEHIQFIKDNLPGRTCNAMRELFNQHFGLSITPQIMRSFCKNRRLYNRDVYEEVRVGRYNKKRRERKYKHRLIWEQAHGKIPPGHVVTVADGNKRNCALDNLLLVSWGELVTMNRLGLISEDRDLTKAGKAVADILIAAKKRGMRFRRGKRNDGTGSGGTHRV